GKPLAWQPTRGPAGAAKRSVARNKASAEIPAGNAPTKWRRERRRGFMTPKRGGVRVCCKIQKYALCWTAEQPGSEKEQPAGSRRYDARKVRNCAARRLGLKSRCRSNFFTP